MRTEICRLRLLSIDTILHSYAQSRQYPHDDSATTISVVKRTSSRTMLDHTSLKPHKQQCVSRRASRGSQRLNTRLLTSKLPKPRANHRQQAPHTPFQTTLSKEPQSHVPQPAQLAQPPNTRKGAKLDKLFRSFQPFQPSKRPHGEPRGAEKACARSCAASLTVSGKMDGLARRQSATGW